MAMLNNQMVIFFRVVKTTNQINRIITGFWGCWQICQHDGELGIYLPGWSEPEDSEILYRLDVVDNVSSQRSDHTRWRLQDS